MLFTIGRTENTMGFRSKTQGPDFFDDLTSLARQLVLAVEFLTQMYAASPEERVALRDQLHEVEHRGDELNHEIIQRINSSFITPFDREDLQSLASHLDDCLDFIDEAGDLLVLYGITDIPASLVSMLDIQIEVIKNCAELTAESMSSLKSPVDLRDYWIEINRLENEGDLTYRRTLTALFDSGLDAITIIKLKDIIYSLESCTDAFEELANVIESLALKES